MRHERSSKTAKPFRFHHVEKPRRSSGSQFWFSGLKQFVLASCTSVMQEYVKYLLFILLLLPPLNQLSVLCLFNFLARWISFLKMWTFRVEGDSFLMFSGGIEVRSLVISSVNTNNIKMRVLQSSQTKYPEDELFCSSLLFAHRRTGPPTNSISSF